MRKIFFLALLSLLLFLPGCWSKVEIEDLAIVSAIGIDRIEVDGKKKWRVSLDIYHPEALAPMGGEGGGGGSGGGQSTSWVVSSIGDTIEEAANNFSSRSPRVLFYAHTQFIVVGKETAEEEELADILAPFLSFKEIRLRNQFLVSDASALETLNSGWELEQDLGDEVTGLVEETSPRLSKSKSLDLKETVDALVTPGKDVITGRLMVFPTPESPQRGDEVSSQEKKISIRLRGSAVFSRGKMVGWFEDLETRGYLFAKGKAEMTVIPISLENEELFKVNARLLKSKSDIKVEIHDGLPKIKLKVKAEGLIEEMGLGDYQVTSQFLDEIGQKASQKIKDEILEAINKAKLYRADIFGFGQNIYRKHPKYWRKIQADWRDYFEDLLVEVEVKTYIRRAGAVNQPLKSR